MRIGAFEIEEPVPDLNEPHAFTIIRPWIDVGSVGSITLARIEANFEAKELGKLARPGTFFDFTRYRPTLRAVEGRREVTIPNSVIKYAKPEGGPDMLFFHLLEPHAFAEDYSDSILEVFKHFSIGRYCRLGSMYDTVPHTRPLSITGEHGGVTPINDTNIVKLRRSKYEGPTTILNLVNQGVSKLDKIDALTFLVHLPQYFQVEEDYAGASRMLEALSSFYDIPSDVKPSQRGQRQYQELTNAIERNNELKTLVRQLEAHYDAQEASAQDDEVDIAPFAPEVERFLKEMDKRFGESGQSKDEPG